MQSGIPACDLSAGRLRKHDTVAFATWDNGADPRVSPGKFMLISLIVALEAIDVLTTNASMALPGTVETNRLMVMLQGALGDFWWLPKLLLVAPIVYVLAKYPKFWPTVLIVVYCAFVVADNLYVIGTANRQCEQFYFTTCDALFPYGSVAPEIAPR